MIINCLINSDFQLEANYPEIESDEHRVGNETRGKLKLKRITDACST